MSRGSRWSDSAITFLGHSDFVETAMTEQKLLSVLEAYVGDAKADFYFGGYGHFDAFALKVGKLYRKTHPRVTLAFVTPYMNDPRIAAKAKDADTVLFPPLENVPPKFAIAKRNQYMAERADLLIAYITRSYGGAYQTYAHALKKGKRLINLAETAPFFHITEQTILNFNPNIHSTTYFARHVLCYLREHKELLTQPDYKHLYDETLDFLTAYIEVKNQRIVTEMDKEREFTEFYIDLINKHTDERFEKFSAELIDKYLAYRRKLW